MAKYVINDKEVTEEYFYKQVFNMDEQTIKNTPFFLDEVIGSTAMSPKTDEELLKTLLNPHLRGSELREEWKTTNVDMSKDKGKNIFEGVAWISDKISAEESKKIEEIRTVCLNNKIYPCLEDVTEIFKCVSEEELESILKRDMSIGAPDWSQNDTGGTVFEKLQDSNLTKHPTEEQVSKTWLYIPGSNTYKSDALEEQIKRHKVKHEDPEEKSINNFCDNVKAINQNKEGKGINNITHYSFPAKTPFEDTKVGKKETENKIDYSEVNLEILDLMANRFSANKHKYPKGNSLKKLNKQDILWAAFRHIKKMIQPIEGDPESYVDHLAAVCTNMSIILDQLKIDKNE